MPSCWSAPCPPWHRCGAQGCIGTRKPAAESSTTSTTSRAAQVHRKAGCRPPEEHKLPRDEDGAFNLRAKDGGKLRDGTKKYAGFNINSPKQLVGKLEAVLGKTPKDANGKPSASRQALRAYAADHEVIQIYLEWKRCEKRRQMIESIQEKMGNDGFVRASYMQLGAESGRMSCVKPNNQQIPRDPQFRGCVEAPDGYLLVDADFGQMELRLAASVANDARMIQAFQDGEDPHTVTAESIGCDRRPQSLQTSDFCMVQVLPV